MTTTFENLLSLAGGFGRWQVGIIAATFFSGFFLNFNHGCYVYHSAEPDHWCRVKELDYVNWTQDEIKEISIPREYREGKNRFSRCSVFQRNYSELIKLPYEEAAKMAYQEGGTERMACHSWHYDSTYFTSTTVSEWNLVCERTALRPTIQGVYKFGVLCSAFFFGPAMDRLGRKTAVIIGVLILIPSMFASAISPNYIFFLVVRFLAGFSVAGVYSSCYVLMLEVMSVGKRTISTIAFDLGPPISVISFAGISYLLPDWRNLYFSAAGSSCILLAYIWILPESPRWLLLKGRFNEAEVVLRNAAKWNGKEMPNCQELTSLMTNFWESEVGSKPKPSSSLLGRSKKILVLWLTPEMRARSLKMFWTWFVVSLVAFGITYLSVRLPLSTHLIMLVHGCKNLIVRITATWPLIRFGRRIMYTAGYVIMAIFLFTFLFIPTDYPYAAWTVLLLASCGCAINFTLVYLYTAELFPTEVRGLAVSVGSLNARIGAILAPFMVDLMGANNRLIPGGILAGAALTAGVTSLLLPETKGVKLSDTIEDIEKLRQDKKTDSIAL